ncbi:hypothetical protein FRB98_002198 [Tulasnella sp. 332]|nr:hypothetical protein FRB98_002198 [Tulasnella sp. 332]
MDTDTLQIAKRSVEDLSIIVNALLTPDPLKSIVAGIPSVVLQIIRILETAKWGVEGAKAPVAHIATVTDDGTLSILPLWRGNGSKSFLSMWNGYATYNAIVELSTEYSDRHREG